MRCCPIILWWCFLSVYCFGNHLQQAQVDKKLGIYWQNIDPSKALNYFKQSLDAHKNAGNIEEAVHINMLIATAYCSMNKYEQQLVHLKKALQDVLELDNPKLEISILYQLSEAYIHLKNYELAEEYSAMALEESRNYDGWMLDDIMMGQATIEFQKGNYQISIELAKELLVFAREKGHSQTEVACMCHIGDCLIRMKKYREARSILQECLNITPLDDTPDYSKTLQLMTVLDSVTGNFASAFDFQQQLEQYAAKKQTLKLFQKQSDEAIHAELQHLDSQLKSLRSTYQKQETRTAKMNHVLVFLVVMASVGGILLVWFWYSIKKLKPKKKRLMDEYKILLEKTNNLSNKYQALMQKQETLQKTNDSLSGINRYKTELFKEISHDLQTPLIHLQQNLNKLMMDISEEQFREITAELTNMVGDISLLLENLLQWSKYQSQGILPKPHYVKITTLVNESIEQQKYGAAEKRITITNALQQHIFVYADEDMTKSVLKNILQNIIKLSNPNASITISGDKDKQFGWLQINYSGQMPLKHTFIQLFQTENYGAEQTETGKAISFGWMLCRSLMKANNSDIHVGDTSDGTLNVILHFPLGSNKSEDDFYW